MGTLVREFDPRMKIIASVVFTCAFFASIDFLPRVLFMVVAFITAVCTGVSLSKMLHRLRSVLFFVFFPVVFNLGFSNYKKDVILRFGFFCITKNSLRTSALMLVSVTTIMFMGQALLSSTDSNKIARSFEFFFAPLRIFGINTDELSITVMLMLRFFPIIFEESKKIISAQRLRGANLESRKNIIRKIKILSCVVIPVFASCFRKAMDISAAMECRCYGFCEKRTHMEEMKFKKTDIIFLAVFCVLIFGVTIFCKIYSLR
jgi:energy-coupling factor transport system permease protein